MRSSRVLLIDADGARASSLESALAGLDVEVRTAPSGLYALTLIERDRPDLVAARLPLADIPFEALTEILRSDPLLEDVALAVLVSNGHRPLCPVTAILSDRGSPAPLASELATLARRHARPAAGAEITPAEGASVRSNAIFISLGRLDLVDLTRGFCRSRKSGKLALSLLGGPAEIIFDGGRVVHARFADLRGREAFARVLALTAAAANSMFYFVALDPDQLRAVTPTIDLTVEGLLRSVAGDPDARVPPA